MRIILILLTLFPVATLGVNLSTSVHTITTVLSTSDSWGIVVNNACHLSNITPRSAPMCRALNLQPADSAGIRSQLSLACPDLNTFNYRRIQGAADDMRNKYSQFGRQRKFFDDINHGIKGVISRRGIAGAGAYVRRALAY